MKSVEIWQVVEPVAVNKSILKLAYGFSTPYGLLTFLFNYEAYQLVSKYFVVSAA